MAISPFPHPTPAGVVGEACAGLDALTGSLWSARTDAELVAGVEELQQLKAKAAALEAELLAEVDARDLAKKQLAWGSTADWFTHLAGTTRRRGRDARPGRRQPGPRTHPRETPRREPSLPQVGMGVSRHFYLHE